ncbi:Pyruvate kinase [Spironucleus salmonicida]|uniref:Pyruvate kinase n=1 Tax=Spironucleus salmonicida TaxID=348837 RepID=V6LC23_9EUKA|nr:Pyruvate kinase [Spironucleus salmonicida]|eukprot:EST42055.1 Pyruvate kinase [Spironucleus salmonicida]
MNNKTPNSIPYKDNANMMATPIQSIKTHQIYAELPCPATHDIIESLNATQQLTGFFINGTEASLEDIKKTYSMIKEKSSLKILVLTNSAIKTNQLKQHSLNVEFISENGDIAIYDRTQIPAQQSVLIDREFLMSTGIERWEVPGCVKKSIKALKGKTIFVSGEIFQTMSFGTAPTRADVGDLFNLCQDGVYGFILTAATAKAKDPIFTVQGVFDTISVFENEAQNTLK